MRIESFEVTGLFGKQDVRFSSVNTDLNILTGRNGVGKTSLLKLLWYIVSGNLLLATREVIFQKTTIVTNLYACTVWRINSDHMKVEITIDGKTTIYEDEEDEDFSSEAEDRANPVLISKGSSVFFPTFRRIEGGFSLARAASQSSTSQLYRPPRPKNDVEDSLGALARQLTNLPHLFITSLSTVDIVNLLLSRYTDMSQNSNDLQQTTSQQIIETIKAFKRDEKEKIEAANTVLDEIRTRIEKMEATRETIMSPLTAVEKLVQRLFRHSGIQLGRRVTFGEAASAINSDALSAGEKQMLSFICYNAFTDNSIFFIDEPELSLHIDWQRQLFSILQSQGTRNQFIIATHSPFIYSKFPDKELCLDEDRGDSEEGSDAEE